MSDVWIEPRATPGSSLGHGVWLGGRGGIPIGWVGFDRAEGLWRSWCRIARCHELGQAYRRDGAAELISEHWLVEHR